MPIGTSDGQYYASSMEFHVSPLVAEGKLKPIPVMDTTGFRQSSDVENRESLVDELTAKIQSFSIPDMFDKAIAKTKKEYGFTDEENVINADEYYKSHPEAKPPSKAVSEAVAKRAIESNEQEGMYDTGPHGGDFMARWDRDIYELNQEKEPSRYPRHFNASSTGNLTNSPDEILEGVDSGTPQVPKGGGGLGKQWAKEKAENAKIRATRDQPVPDFEHDNTAEIDRLIAKEQAGTAIKPEIEKLKNMLWDRYAPKKAGNRYD